MIKKDNKSITLIIWITAGLVVLVGFGLCSKGIGECTDLLRKLGWPLLRLIILIAVGLLIGNIIEGLGLMHKISFLARPLMRCGRLCDRSGAAFTTAFVSGVAANTMLINSYQDRKISKKEMIVTALLNGLPAYFLHLPTTFLIVLPLTGTAGILYFLLTFGATIARTICYLLYARFSFTGNVCKEESVSIETKSWGEVWQNTKEKLPTRFKQILVYIIPAYSFIFLIQQWGAFDWLRHKLAAIITTQFIPVEGVSVIVFSLVAEFTSGFAAAGALLDSGALTVKETVIALLLGNIIATPIRALRHQLPHLVGIFTPKLGSQILVLGQGIRIVSVLIIMIVYYYLG